MVRVDVLYHDNRVVGDEAKRRGDAGERHQIDRLSRNSQREPDDRHSDGDRGYGNQREAPITQEQQQNHGRQDDAEDDRVSSPFHRVGNELGLIVEVAPTDAFRQQIGLSLEEELNTVCDCHGARRRLANDVHENGTLTVGRRSHVRDGIGDSDLTEIGQRRWRSSWHSHGDLRQ